MREQWCWLDDGWVPLTAAVTYAAWTFPLFSLFLRDPLTGARNTGFSFWLCAAVLLAGAAVDRLFAARRTRVLVVVLAGLASVSVSLLLTSPVDWRALPFSSVSLPQRAVPRGQIIPAPVTALLCAVMLWSRGLRISRADPDEAMGAFVVGAIALAGLLLVALALLPDPDARPAVLRGVASGAAPMAFLVSIPVAASFVVMSPFIGGWAVVLSHAAVAVGLLSLAVVLPRGPRPGDLVGWMLAFLVSGWANLALLSASRTLSGRRAATGVRGRLDRYWVFVTVGVVGSILSAGLVLGRALGPTALVAVFGWLKRAGAFVVDLTLVLAFALAYLFFSLVDALPFDIFRGPRQVLRRLLEFLWRLRMPVEEGAAYLDRVSPLSPAWGYIVRLLLLLLTLGFVVWVFARIARRWRQRSCPEGVRETRESVLSVALLREQLGALSGALKRPVPALFFLAPGSEGDPRWVVRRLYRRLLARAARQGLPREARQTPFAYQSTLLGLYPEERSSLEALTLVYAATRYGVAPPTPEEVKVAQEALTRILSANAYTAEGS